VPGGGECGPCHDFASNTLAFALKLKKNYGKTSVKVTEGRSADQRRTRFVLSTLPSRAMASDWPSGPRRSCLSRQATVSTLDQR